MLKRLKRLKKVLLLESKISKILRKEKSALKLPVALPPRRHFTMLIPLNLAVTFLIILFVPTQVVSTLPTQQIARTTTTVSNAEREDIGLIPAHPDTTKLVPNLDCPEDFFEYEQSCSDSLVFRGKLRSSLSFWRDIVQASSFVVDVIENGFKLLFVQSPSPYNFKNRSSALRHNDFVEEAILELLQRGCIQEVDSRPAFCNPLHVAQQSSGKLRLILDLSHLNLSLVKKRVKYEDLRTVLQVFSQGMFVFAFDLKSAYHHIEICAEHTKFLAFQWTFPQGETKFYEFLVLPFGLSSAPYIFTKVMRQLVKFWRGLGLSIVLYLDDGIGGSSCIHRAKSISHQVQQDLSLSGFTINNEKSRWEPRQKLTFLGTILDFNTGMLFIPEGRLSKLKSSIQSCLDRTAIRVRELASITGQIISLSCGFGNITRLLSRRCYAAIEQRSSWDEMICLSQDVTYELQFWLNNVDSMNGRRMVPKSSAVGVVFSDASASGFGGYSVQCGSNLVAGSWSEGESKHSSTMREILAVKYVLLSLIERLSGLTIKWFSDNQNVPRIIEHGSSKEHLQTEAMSIFHTCCAHGISLEMEWIPRSDNEKADFLSRLQDTDDWGLSLSTFTSIDSVWGPHTIDRFANFRNTKLARFNSRYWNPGSEAIDTFIIDWSGENNYLCPPISLIPRVLLHMKNCHACGTLVVPLWPSSPFWPMICSDGWHLNDFILAWMDLPTSKEAFTAGSCGSLFGNEDLHFRMLALRVRF